MQDSNLYAVLCVTPGASANEIKAAYKRLAQKYHPDKETGDAERFKQIQDAYEILIDPISRKLYDKTGKKNRPVDTIAEDTVKAAFKGVLDRRDLARCDIVAAAREIIDLALFEKRRLKDSKNKRLKELEKYNKRVTRRGKKANTFAAVIEEAIAETLRELDYCEYAIAVQSRALELLAEYSDLMDTALGWDFAALLNASARP